MCLRRSSIEDDEENISSVSQIIATNQSAVLVLWLALLNYRCIIFSMHGSGKLQPPPMTETWPRETDTVPSSRSPKQKRFPLAILSLPWWAAPYGLISGAPGNTSNPKLRREKLQNISVTTTFIEATERCSWLWTIKEWAKHLVSLCQTQNVQELRFGRLIPKHDLKGK